MNTKHAPQSILHFFKALAEGNVGYVKEALAAGISPNVRFQLNRMQPLHIAVAGYARARRTERKSAIQAFDQITQILLDAGADPVALDARNLTPAAAGEGEVPACLRAVVQARRDAGTLEVMPNGKPRTVGSSAYCTKPSLADRGGLRFRRTAAQLAAAAALPPLPPLKTQEQWNAMPEEEPRYKARDLARMAQDGVFDVDTDFDADPISVEGNSLTPTVRCFAEDEANAYEFID